MGWFKRLPAEVRAGVASAVATFTITAGALLSGVLQDLTEWVAEGGDFPDLEAAGRLLIAAGLVAAVGVANTVYRWLQAQGVLPGAPPIYPE